MNLEGNRSPMSSPNGIGYRVRATTDQPVSLEERMADMEAMMRKTHSSVEALCIHFNMLATSLTKEASMQPTVSPPKATRAVTPTASSSLSILTPAGDTRPTSRSLDVTNAALSSSQIIQAAEEAQREALKEFSLLPGDVEEDAEVPVPAPTPRSGLLPANSFRKTYPKTKRLRAYGSASKLLERHRRGSSKKKLLKAGSAASIAPITGGTSPKQGDAGDGLSNSALQKLGVTIVPMSPLSDDSSVPAVEAKKQPEKLERQQSQSAPNSPLPLTPIDSPKAARPRANTDQPAQSDSLKTEEEERRRKWTLTINTDPKDVAEVPVLDRTPSLIHLRSVHKRPSVEEMKEVNFKDRVRQSFTSQSHPYLIPSPTAKELAGSSVIDDGWVKVIAHDSLFRQLWDGLVFASVLFVLIEAPYAVAFNHELASGISSTTDVLFILDLLLNFVTTYRDTETGATITSRQKIAEHYVKSGWFFVDLVSCFPSQFFESTAAGPDSSLFKVFKLVRLLRIGKLFKHMDDLLKANALRMIRLLVGIALVVHWTGCIWYVLADEWNEAFFEERYPGAGPYWSIMYVSATLLFRNPQVAPESDGEKAFATFLIIFGCCLQASVFGSVAVLLAGLDEDEVRYQKRVLSVMTRMKQLHMPVILRERVKHYYEQMWLRQHTLTVDAEEFITELSPSLQCDLRCVAFRDLLVKIPFLNDRRVGSLVVEALCQVLTTVVYLEGDLIYRKGETGDSMGFVGHGGKVGVLDPNKKEPVVIREMGVGSYVGEFALILRVRRTADVVSLAWTRLHVLTREAFDRVKLAYPAEAKLIEAGLNLTSVRAHYEWQQEHEPDADPAAATAAAAGEPAVDGGGDANRLRELST